MCPHKQNLSWDITPFYGLRQFYCPWHAHQFNRISFCSPAGRQYWFWRYSTGMVFSNAHHQSLQQPRAEMRAGLRVTAAAHHDGYFPAIQTHLPFWQMGLFTLTNSFLGFPSFMPPLHEPSSYKNFPRLPFSDALWRVLWIFGCCCWPHPSGIYYLLSPTVGYLLMLNVFFSQLNFKFLKSIGHELYIVVSPHALHISRYLNTM